MRRITEPSVRRDVAVSGAQKRLTAKWYYVKLLERKANCQDENIIDVVDDLVSPWPAH